MLDSSHTLENTAKFQGFQWALLSGIPPFPGCPLGCSCMLCLGTTLPTCPGWLKSGTYPTHLEGLQTETRGSQV